MKDKEKIISGLECCMKNTSQDPFESCRKCPYDVSISVQECVALLCKDALELIMVQNSVEYALTVLRRNGWKETEK